MRIAVSSAALLALAACQPSGDAHPSPGHDAVVAEVQEKMAAIIDGVNRHDPAATSQFNAPDYEFYSHGLPNVVGAEAALANNQALLSDDAIHIVASNPRIEVSSAGDMAVYSAAYAWDYTDLATGGVGTETGNWILIFKRQPDGSLAVWREIASDTPQAE